MLSKILDALTSGIKSVVNPAKSFSPRHMLALIDAATWEQRVLLDALARQAGVDPDKIVAEAIERDRGGK